MIIGILMGIGTALFQSLAYLASRYFTDRREGRPVDLLLAAHIMMGIAAGCILLIAPREEFPPVQSYIFAGLGTTLCYLAAQFSVYTALSRAAASIVSPLMGLKLLFVVLGTVLAFSVRYTGLQISSVFLALGAAFVLNYSGSAGRVDPRALLWVLSACILFAASDIFIQIMVRPFAGFAPLTRGLYPLAVSHSMGGLISLGLAPLLSRLDRKAFAAALPYTFFWSIGIFLFFATVGQLGIMYATILQSGRGLMNVVLGVIVGLLGFTLLEQRHGAAVILRRIVGALMMTGAVALFGLGG